MKRRIIAWVLLVGFVLLLVNILFIGYERMLSLFVYAVAALIFLIFGRKSKEKSDDE